MITAVALITLRNEEIHLPHVVEHLIAEGIEVIVLNDGSTDGTEERLESLLGNGLLEIRWRPSPDQMSLRDLLNWEASVIDEIRHDWVLHVDADEWLRTDQDRLRLIDLLNEANSSGATAVNFEEFVFTPVDTIPEGVDPRRLMLEYYFFEPSKQRLVRAWRRDAGLDNRRQAGHRLDGGQLSVFPLNGVLRHYPIVTPDQGLRKYRSRRYDPTELARGWHKNRLPLIKADHIPRPDGGPLHVLDRWDSRDLDRSTPSKYHFWEELWNSDSGPRRSMRRSDGHSGS